MEGSQTLRRQPSTPEDGRCWSRVISCAEHGTSAWCYIQDDGSHIDSDQCRCCLMPSEHCPVDVHRASVLALQRNGVAELLARGRGANGRQ